MASNFISPCFPHFFPFQMHFLPTSSPSKMHVPSDHKSLHNCPVRPRQLARRGHKAVLRPSSRGIDAQLSSPLQLVSSSLWGWSGTQLPQQCSPLGSRPALLATQQSFDTAIHRFSLQPFPDAATASRDVIHERAHRSLPAYAWTRDRNESEPSLVKSFGPSSCSTQFNTKFFTLFSGKSFL